ncbi:ABC transporter permease [Ruicaihuangia caeni]|uniref:ABC transporter permease n=1 Tax=Ruicaihuangia caeni TaxID=3042517 RepID=UPI00338E53A4
MRLVRSEFRKLLTTRIWWVLLIVEVAYVAFIAGLFALLFSTGADLGDGAAAPAPEGMHELVYSAASSIGYVFPVLLGTLAVTSEFRHQTLTPTFLTTPRRSRTLLGKIVALAIMGAVFGIAAFAIALLVGAPLLAVGGLDTGLGDQETWLMVTRGVLALMLWSIIGVGLGALVPNQVAAIVIVLAFTQFIEPILRTGAAVWEWAADVGKFLPGAASDALVGASFLSMAAAPGSSSALLEWWQGALVLVGIAAILVGIGSFTTWKRDVS